MIRHIVLLSGLLSAATAMGAAAQGNPSADQIINSLRPGGNMLGTTRGIRPVGPAPEAPSAPRPVQPAAAPGATPGAAMGAKPGVAAPRPAAPATAQAAPSVDLSVQFANNSAELTPAAIRTLTELGRALTSSTLGAYRFRIEGHTDTVGTPESNKVLSERRAQAVVAFLTTRFHIDAARLESAGLGEDGLLVQTGPSTPEPRNRRVQVINLGA